jgi:hypothetical protein
LFDQLSGSRAAERAVREEGPGELGQKVFRRLYTKGI